MTTATKEPARITEFMGELHKLTQKFRDIDIDLCATYVSPGVGVDAGGFVIVGGHLIKVPGWNPSGPEFARAKVAVASAAFTITSLMSAGEEKKKVEPALFRDLGIKVEQSRTISA